MIRVLSKYDPVSMHLDFVLAHFSLHAPGGALVYQRRTSLSNFLI